MKAICCISVIPALAFLSALCARGQAPGPLERALRVIEHFEKRIERIEFKSSMRLGGLASAEDISTAKWDDNSQQETFVLLEPFTGRTRLQTSGYGKWQNGVAPYAGYNCLLTFDGTQQRELVIQGHGKTVPKEGKTPGLGEICGRDYDSSKRGKFVSTWMLPTGVGFFPPFLFGEKLSELLKKVQQDKHSLVMKENKAGMWVFTMDAVVENLIIKGCSINVVYDPNRGVVLGIDWETKKEIWRRILFDLNQTRNGFWVPRKTDDVNLLDKIVSEWTFENVRINEPVEENIFRLKFPLGTLVVDELDKKRYVVGNGAINDEAAILSYAQLHGLRLTEDPPTSTRPEFTRWDRVLVGSFVVLAVLMAVLVIIYLRRRPRERPGNGPAMGIVLLLSLSFLGRHIHASEINERGEWLKKGAPGDDIYLSQCGWNVAVLTLACFGKPARLAHMTEVMPPTQEGVNLADMKLWLEANNLTCVSRKNVKLGEVNSFLEKKMMAIFAIKGSLQGYNHFVAAINHPALGKLFLNPPSGPVPLSEAVHSPLLEPVGGMVLFVTEALDRKKQAEEVTVSPPQIQLGTFAPDARDASTPIVHTIRLKNRSAWPVHITDITSQCGCIWAKSSVGVLRPGESRNMEFWLSKAGWSRPGVQEKTISLVFADGSTKHVLWIGEPVFENRQRDGTEGLNAHPKRLVFLIQDGQGTKESTTLSLRHHGIDTGDLAFSADQGWLSSTLADNGKPGENSLLRVSIDPGKLNFSAGSDSAKGIVRVRHTKATESCDIEVVAFRKAAFQVEPDTLVFDSFPVKQRVHLRTTLQSAQNIERIEVTERPDGLGVDILKDNEGAATIVCHAARMKKGDHFLTIQVCDKGARKSTASVLIRVK